MSSYLISLLHLSDPTLPIGAFSHSYGLETYVLKGVVCSKDSAKEYISNSLSYNIKYNDALYLRLAWEEAKNRNLEQLTVLDSECTALKSPQECRSASLKLGNRLSQIFYRQSQRVSGVSRVSRVSRDNSNIDWEFIEKFCSLISSKKLDGHYSIVYGVIAHCLGVDIRQSLTSFYFNSLVGMVTNCNKLVPIGQRDGQDIIFELEEIIPTLVAETLEVNSSLRGACTPAFDIRAMQHERLYSRLYMS